MPASLRRPLRVCLPRPPASTSAPAGQSAGQSGRRWRRTGAVASRRVCCWRQAADRDEGWRRIRREETPASCLSGSFPPDWTMNADIQFLPCTARKHVFYLFINQSIKLKMHTVRQKVATFYFLIFFQFWPLKCRAYIYRPTRIMFYVFFGQQLITINNVFTYDVLFVLFILQRW